MLSCQNYAREWDVGWLLNGQLLLSLSERSDWLNFVPDYLHFGATTSNRVEDVLAKIFSA